MAITCIRLNRIGCSEPLRLMRFNIIFAKEGTRARTQVKLMIIASLLVGPSTFNGLGSHNRATNEISVCYGVAE